MTSPFVIQSEGAGGLAKSLAPLMHALQARQELNLQYAKLQQDQQEFDLRSKLIGAQTEGADLENAKRKIALKNAQDDIVAKQEALRLVTGNLTAGSGDTSWGQVFASIKDPAVAEHALNYHKLFAETETTDLNQQRAKVDLARAGVDLGAAKSDADIKALNDQVAHAGLRTALAAAGASDPAHQEAFLKLAMTGIMPLGAAAHQTGTVLTKDLNPGFTIPQELIHPKSEALSQDQRKAKTFYLLASNANPIINGVLRDQAARGDKPGLSYLANLVRGAGGESAVGVTMASIENTLLSHTKHGAEQQQLGTAQKEFGDALRYFVSGQQTSDKEGGNILSYSVERVGDLPPVIKQKARMREVVLDAMKQASEGTAPFSQALLQGAMALRATGFDPKALAALEAGAKKARATEAARAAGKIDLNNDPTTSETMGPNMNSVRAMLDSAGVK